MSDTADLDASVSAMSVGSVLESLGAGIPLTLLMDLAPADGPDSDAIFNEEPPDSLDWIPAQRA